LSGIDVKMFVMDYWRKVSKEHVLLMIPDWIVQNLAAAQGEGPRYQRIADVIGKGIKNGLLPTGYRLPTVRRLAKGLGVSDATVAAAYRLMFRHGQVQGRVGSGTYVVNRSENSPQGREPSASADSDPTFLASPWRRRTLTGHAAHLRAAYPNAFDCTSGRPDPGLFPLASLQQAWRSAIKRLTYDGLQYAGPYPLNFLAEKVTAVLQADSVDVLSRDIVVGTSTQQLIMLGLNVASRINGSARLVVALEEPGYPTILDSLERMGHQLIGLTIDEQGVCPASLEKAIAAGARVAIFTPRAQNPTGASWTSDRRAALSDLIRNHRDLLVIEDDYFAGLTNSRPGSLISDERIADQLIYIRSFSKSIAPDLRIAIAAAKARLRALLFEEKSFADGWTSHSTQLATAFVLEDPATEKILKAATKAYAERREAAIRVLLSEAHGLARTITKGDGLSVWVELSNEVRPSEVVEQAAALGVIIAPGEPFYLAIGRNNAVRFNAGSARDVAQACQLGRTLATAIVKTAESSAGSFLIPHV
jgi:DNA-binding transcriptional MocR family regulator